MRHFRVRLATGDFITLEQCIDGGLTDTASNSVLSIGHQWNPDTDLSLVERWLVTVLLQGPPLEGNDVAVKQFVGLDTIKVTTCDGGPYCTLQG